MSIESERRRRQIESEATSKAEAEEDLASIRYLFDRTQVTPTTKVQFLTQLPTA